MPTKGLRPAKCPHCHKPILWGTFQNGCNRSFDPQPRPIDDIPPADRYAYSRRARAVVCLDGEPHPPTLVLTAHYCEEYVEARLLRETTPLGVVLADIAPNDPPPPNDPKPRAPRPRRVDPAVPPPVGEGIRRIQQAVPR